VPKPVADGHGFQFEQAHDDGSVGKMEGRPIDTIGYRGMHSYEVAFDNWFVPAANLVGGEAGLGRGFYLQMAGFENGRLQTAARAIGVMQAAYEAALTYAENRKVFESNIIDYQLIRAKLGRMAMLIQASRQFAYVVARQMGEGQGQMEASMIKAYVCKAAARGAADPRWHGLRRGVRGEPTLRRRPGAVDLRGRRRDPLPQGHRQAPHRQLTELADRTG
jgi:(2S)-methylsuccinyl-CoA dehydrogenase